MTTNNNSILSNAWDIKDSALGNEKARAVKMITIKDILDNARAVQESNQIFASSGIPSPPQRPVDRSMQDILKGVLPQVNISALLNDIPPHETKSCTVDYEVGNGNDLRCFDTRGRYTFSFTGKFFPKYINNVSGVSVAHDAKIAFQRLRMRMEYDNVPIYYQYDDFWKSLRVSFQRLFSSVEKKNGCGPVICTAQLLRRVNLFVSIWETGSCKVVYPELVSQLLFPEATSNLYKDELVPEVLFEPQGLMDSFRGVMHAPNQLEDIKELLTGALNEDRIKDVHALIRDVNSGALGNSVTKTVLQISLITVLTTFTVVEMSCMRGRYARILTMLSVAACVQFGPGIMKFLLHAFDPPEGEVLPQMGTDALLNGVSCLLMFSAVGSAKSIPTELFRSLSSLDRVKKSLKDVYNLLVVVVEKLFSVIGLEALLPKSLFIYHTQSNSIQDFFTAYESIESCLNKHTFSLVQENFDQVQKLLKTGESLYTDIPQSNETAGIRVLIHDSIVTLRRVRQRFIDSNFQREGLRQEPVCMLLRGGPGVLKSQSLEHFSHDIACRVLKGEDQALFAQHPSRFIFNRQAETVYWAGYDSEKLITIFDDFGQARDVAGNADNEYMNLIRAVNEFEYDLHMADLGSKGNTKFSSKFVLATTNLPSFNVESIVEKKALLRRFTCTYTVVPKAEYCRDETLHNDLMLRTIDPSKLPIGVLGVTSTSPEVLEFHEYDLFSENHTGKICTFSQVVDIMVQAERLKAGWFEQKKIELRDRRARVIDMALLIAPSSSDSERKFFLETYREPGYLFTTAVDCGGLEQSIPEEFVSDIRPFYDNEMVKYIARSTLAFSVADASFPSREFCLYSMTQQFGPDFLWSFVNGDDTIFLDSLRMWKSISSSKESSLGVLGFITAKGKYTLTYQKLKFKTLRFVDVCNDLRKSVQDKLPWDITNMAASLAVFTASAPFVYLGVKYFADKYATHPDADTEYHFKWDGKCHYVEHHDERGRMVERTNCFDPSTCPENTYTARRSSESKARKHMSAKELKARFAKSVPQTQASYKHPLRETPVTPEMAIQADRSGYNIIEKVRRRNCCEFLVQEDSGNYVRYGYIVFVEGRIALIPYHFILGMAHDAHEDPSKARRLIKLRRLNKDGVGATEFSVSFFELMPYVEQCTDMNGTDLCLVKFPDRVQPFATVTQWFPTQANLDSLREYPFRLIVPGIEQVSVSCGRGEPIQNLVVTPSFSTEYVITNGLRYSALTEPGDCGALLTIVNPQMPKAKIFGMHVAGNAREGLGHATFCTQEQILSCLTLFRAEDRVSCEFESDVIPQSGAVVGQGQFCSLYDLTKPIPQSTKSKIKKSLLYDLFHPAKLEPARLRSFVTEQGNMIDPWANAFSKITNTQVYVSDATIEAVACSYRDFLTRVSKKSVVKTIYSFEEAVLGTDDPDFGSINRTTSPGYPYVLEPVPGMPGRKRFFGDGVDYDLNNPHCVALKKRVLYIVECAKRNVRLEHIFVDCLKDELRPRDKVLEGKTRLFNACPVDLLIIYRMYFGAFQLWYKKNRVTNHSALGINVYSHEWMDIYRYLIQYGDSTSLCCGAGDYSGFDATEIPLIHYYILDVINRWYDDDPLHQRIRKVLWLELVNSKHIQGNTIYEWGMSLPSGHPLTSLVNTMYNGIAYRWCWFALNGFNTSLLWKFDDHVRMIAMGDDSAYVVSPEYRESFTEERIGSYMKLLGLLYTSELKDSSGSHLRSIHDITFLKRKFRLCPIVDQIVAPFDLHRLLEILYWTKDRYDSVQISRDDVDSVLEELTLHGKEVFNTYVNQIVQASVDKLDYGPKCTNFRALYNIVREREFEL